MPGRVDVGRVLVRAGDEVAAVHFLHRRAARPATRRAGSTADVGGDRCPSAPAPWSARRSQRLRPSVADDAAVARASSAARSTFHARAAWSISISRAVAAALRQLRRHPRRRQRSERALSNGVRSVSAITIVMDASGTRSSSATVCASDVRMFWPISTLPVYAVHAAALVDVQPRGELRRVGARPADARGRIPAPARRARRAPSRPRPPPNSDEVAALDLERVSARFRQLVAFRLRGRDRSLLPPIADELERIRSAASCAPP